MFYFLIKCGIIYIVEGEENIMKYKVTTSYLTGAGDMSHDDEWIFDTREEAQEFVDKFHEAFPKDESSHYAYMPCDAYDPYIYTDEWVPEIEEIDDTRPDPYAWLNKQIKEKEERLGRK